MLNWMASKHSRWNYRTTQNTFCAQCHSPLQARPESTLKLIPYLMKQHKEWWPSHMFKSESETSTEPARKLDTPEDYLMLWQEFEDEAQNSNK